MAGGRATFRLGRAQAAALVEACAAQLGETDLDRLRTMLGLMEQDRRINFAKALEAVFPEHDLPAAQTRLRQLRRRFALSAAESEVKASLDVDSKKRSDPDQRWLWFTGEDPAASRATERSRQAIRPGIEQERVDQQAVLVDSSRKRISVFICATDGSDETGAVADLIDRLRVRLASDSEYAFDLWHESSILPGEHREVELRRHLATCHVGLVLLNWHLLSDSRRVAEQLRKLLEAPDPRPRVVPVLLTPIPTDGSVSLHGLESLSLLDATDGFDYAEMDTGARRRFIDKIANQVRQALDDAPGAWLEARDRDCERERARARTAGRYVDPADRLAAYAAAPDHDIAIVPPRGTLASLAKSPRSEDPPRASTGFDVLDFLEEWACVPGPPNYFALLGEYGIGKTTSCEALTRRLIAARADDEVPAPVYLDLRRLGETAGKAELTLPEIVETALERSWSTDRYGAERLSAEQVIRLVREERAVVIFDGLDEVLVHLGEAAGQRFTRELLSILPPRLVDDGEGGVPAASRVPGKVLISCRTHYFRTLRDQATHFTGEDREAMGSERYGALLLLPFRLDQIRAYVEQNLPGRDPEGVLELMAGVHNLTELAERPYLLRLICEQIEEIERARLRGEAVTGVTLYRHMVRSWLERDAGKHQLGADHKMWLMEQLAASLWREGRRSWRVQDLEHWLVDILADQPGIAAHYAGKGPDLLKEDLRTATFLVRPGEDEFRFAHASLHEFFLASYLLHALVEQRLDDWQLPTPTWETLDFLGQLLAEENDGRALAGLRAIRDRYRPCASELALRYAMLAARRGYPAPSLAGLHMEGADLRDLRFIGPAQGPRLNLAGARFRRCRLDRSWFQRVDLERADFDGSCLHRVELVDCRAVGATFKGADLAGTIFRRTDLSGAGFRDVRCHRTQFLDCPAEDGAVPPDDTFVQPGPSRRGMACERASLRAFAGHAGWVGSCAFSRDGERIVSAGVDGTVRIWDAQAGEELRRLEGHEGRVGSCAFSRDGERIVSAGADGTVRIWDALRGEELRRLEGHQGWVASCAFSRDGERIVSAGSDGTVRIWDALRGEALRRLEGHEGRVASCAFSRDGERIVSAGSDGTVRIWDALRGEELRRLEGHQGWVASCAFSRDGERIVSAGADGTVRIWDALRGEELGRLEGHQSAVRSCAFSRDGERIVSAGADGTVRIWDALLGEELGRLKGHPGGVGSCAFSRDGERIVSAGADGTVRIWNARRREELRRFEGHQGWVGSCAFSRDGERIVSAGNDGTVRIWDALRGEELGRLEGHEGRVGACAFSRDGERIVSGGNDGTLRIWNAQGGEEGTFRIHSLPDGEWAVLATDGSGAVTVSPGAWRWLGWNVPNTETGELDRLPAEALGSWERTRHG